LTERSGERRSEHRSEVRLTIAEASDLLGISKDAVRMRIKRGTLRSEKTDGRVYVWLNDVPDAEQNTEQNIDPSALIAAKDETIRTLREQLESERRANEENRRLLAGLIERMPALEAGTEPPRSQEPPGASETVEEEPERAESRPDTAGPQTATQPQQRLTLRSLRRRIFGGS
jgi:excisionase family DNA binding protein